MKEKLTEKIKNKALEFVAQLYQEGVAPHAILSFLRIKVVASGRIKVSPNTYRAATRHTSHLDTLAVTDALNSHGIYDVRPVASGEYWTPFIKQLVLRAIYGNRAYLTKTKSEISNERGFVEHEVSRILDAGEEVVRVIFPEGGRNRDGVLRSGMFVIVAQGAEEQVDIPIQLVVIQNMVPYLQKGNNIPLDIIKLLSRAALYSILRRHHIVNIFFAEPISAIALTGLVDAASVDDLALFLQQYYNDQYFDHINKTIFTPINDEEAIDVTLSSSDEPYQFLTSDQEQL